MEKPISASTPAFSMDVVSQVLEDYKRDTALREENRAYEINVITGANPNETVTTVSGGDREPIIQAKEPGFTLNDTLEWVRKNSAIVDPNEGLRVMAEQAQKINEMNNNDDVTLEGSLTVGDPNFSPALVRRLVNQQIGAEVIEQKMRERYEGASTAGLVLDFLDRYVIRQIPIGMLEDLSLRVERKGRDLVGAQQSMTPQEYRAFITEYADDAAKEGFFRKDNWFALLQAAGEGVNAGVDPGADVDAVLALPDLFGIGKALKVGKLLTRVAKIKGPAAASDAHAKLSKSVGSVDPEIAVEPHASAFDATNPGAPRPVVARTGMVAVDKSLITEITSTTAKGTFGERATPDQIKEIALVVETKFKNTTSRNIADFDIVPLELGQKQAVFKMGRIDNGEPLKNKSQAIAVAKDFTDKGLAVTVEPVDPTNTKLGYFVVARETLDLTTVANGLDTGAALDFFRRNIAKVIGSTRTLDDNRVNNLANMGEAGFAVLKRIATAPLKVLEKTPLKNQEIITQVYKSMRDGKLAFTRDGLNPHEFAIAFAEESGGLVATPADHAAFAAAKTINDTAYLLKANQIAKRYIAAGYKRIQTDDMPGLARIVDDVPAGEDIYDIAGRHFVDRRSDLPEGTAIWHGENGKYYVSPESVRNIEYKDVFGYNAGGQRLNPDANFFVTLGDGNGRAIMTAYSEKQALIAKTQITNIQDALIATGRRLDDLVDELDDVVKVNNSWAPSLVDDTKSLQAFAAKHGWRLTQDNADKTGTIANPIRHKARGGKTEDGNHPVWGGSSNDLYFQQQGHRADAVLVDFGGAQTYNDSPIKSMIDQLADEMSSYSHSNYTESVISSWVAKAEALGLRSEKFAGRAKFEDMFSQLNARGINTESERSLVQIGNIARRRMGFKDPATLGFEKFGQELREFTFDTFGLKIPKASLVNGLLQMGFQSAFGFMNLGQFVMQASQVSSIIALSPLAGLRASAGAPALRLALHSGSPEGIRRVGRWLGISEEDSKELFEYITISGRYDVQNDAMEKATGPGFGAAGWGGKSHVPSVLRPALYGASALGKKALKIGTMPFTEGERLSRLTAITTAFLERKKAFPGVSAMTPDNRAWISQREQDLTFNMGTASKAALQQGIWRLPSQWTAYSFRAMEAVVIGRDLSKAERIRLGLTLVAQGGLTGVFAGSAYDWIGEKFDVDPSSPTAAAIKYGFYDGIFSAFFSGVSGQDVQTAMGTRLAPMGTFMDIYRKITEENTISALGGPSVEITSAAVMGAYAAIGNLLGGHTASAWRDVEKVTRTATGIDNIVKARGIINYGVYSSKSGTTLDMPFDDIDAVLQALGITNFKVADFYNSKTAIWRETKEVREYTKDRQKEFRAAIELIKRGDPGGGQQLINEINARINSSGFSPYDIHQMRRRMTLDSSHALPDMWMYHLQRNNEAASDRIKSYLDNGTE